MKKYLEIGLHLFVWMVILLYIEHRVESHSQYVNEVKNIAYFIDTNNLVWFWRLSSFFFKAAFFYFLVYKFYPRFEDHLGSSGFIKTLGISLLTVMLLEWTFFYGAYSYIGLTLIGGEVLRWNYHFLSAQGLPYILLLIASFGYWAAHAWVHNRERIRHLDKTSAELALLKTQINPHFLFNTLNNLFGMAIEKEADELAESIMHLTGMMRYTIYENNEKFVPLAKEIDYLQNYIKLQRLRFTDEEVPVRFSVKGEVHGVQISPMLLINFVENAFKHGVSLKKESFINIEVEIVKDEIQFSVVNTIHRQYPNLFIHPGGSGLAHTRKLLQLQYPNKHSLEIFERNELYHIMLRLQLDKQEQKVVFNR